MQIACSNSALTLEVRRLSRESLFLLNLLNIKKRRKNNDSRPSRPLFFLRAAAHWKGKDDVLAKVGPLPGLVSDWRAFLECGMDDQDSKSLRRHE
jgi:hypothetical protein